METVEIKTKEETLDTPEEIGAAVVEKVKSRAATWRTAKERLETLQARFRAYTSRCEEIDAEIRELLDDTAASVGSKEEQNNRKKIRHLREERGEAVEMLPRLQRELIPAAEMAFKVEDIALTTELDKALAEVWDELSEIISFYDAKVEALKGHWNQALFVVTEKTGKVARNSLYRK